MNGPISGSSLTLDLFLGGIITILLLFLLILKEIASASENPDWQRIGNWLYLPIIPLLFLFFILAGYRALLVLGMLPEPRGVEAGTSVPVAEASETITPFEPFVLHLDLTQTLMPTLMNTAIASDTPEPTASPTVTTTPTIAASLPRAATTFPPPTRISPSPTFLPPPTNTLAPAPTLTPEPTEPEPAPEPTETEPPPVSPEPTSVPPSPVPTPTTAPTESEEPPEGRPTPTPAPAPD